MFSLEKLGKRICIIGCSNSGKSTLAQALSKKLNITAYHLDKFAHIENSNWQCQSDEILITKHTRIINQNCWIIDGNYSICMKERFEGATGIIWLDANVYISAFQFLLRSIKNDLSRPGRLAGAKKEFSWRLVKWIIVNYPKNLKKYQMLISDYPNVPFFTFNQ